MNLAFISLGTVIFRATVRPRPSIFENVFYGCTLRAAYEGSGKMG